jgi:hypothetical protein
LRKADAATIVLAVALMVSTAFELVGGDGFDPHELSTQTGLTPSRSWRKGDVAENGRVHSNSYWSLRLGPEESFDLAGQTERLLNQVDPYASAVLDAVAHGAIARVGLWWGNDPDSDSTPYLHFPTELLARIVRLGAGLDFDI